MPRCLAAMIPLFILLTWPASPQAKETEGEQIPALLPPAACPALFGSPASRAENRSTRQQKLDSIAEKAHAINLLHSSNWSDPRPVRVHGLELVDFELPDDAADEAGERRAIVRYDDDEGHLDCPSGYYALAVDDSIGSDLAVLAVLDDLLLLHGQDGLVYLTADLSETPVFRMIWRSSWKMLMLPGKTNPSPTTKRNHASRKANRHANRNRRR